MSHTTTISTARSIREILRIRAMRAETSGSVVPFSSMSLETERLDAVPSVDFCLGCAR